MRSNTLTQVSNNPGAVQEGSTDPRVAGPDEESCGVISLFFDPARELR